jgi:hypothetical protein
MNNLAAKFIGCIAEELDLGQRCSDIRALGLLAEPHLCGAPLRT